MYYVSTMLGIFDPPPFPPTLTIMPVVNKIGLKFTKLCRVNLRKKSSYFE